MRSEEPYLNKIFGKLMREKRVFLSLNPLSILQELIFSFIQSPKKLWLII